MISNDQCIDALHGCSNGGGMIGTAMRMIIKIICKCYAFLQQSNGMMEE